MKHVLRPILALFSLALVALFYQFWLHADKRITPSNLTSLFIKAKDSEASKETKNHQMMNNTANPQTQEPMSLPAHTHTSNLTSILIKAKDAEASKETKNHQIINNTANPQTQEQMILPAHTHTSQAPKNTIVCQNHIQYELGNLFYCRGRWAGMCGNIAKGRAFIRQKKLETTVGAAYFIKANGKPNNVTLLESLLKTSGYERGSRNTSLWHLRLGDNMNGGSFLNDSLVGPRDQQARGKSYYQVMLDAPTSTTQSNVTLMGNMCGGGQSKTHSQVDHGKQYIRDITAFLNDRGITVDTTRINDGGRLVDQGAADKDLAFASTVGHYVCSGGTYSIMIGALVKHNGGTTYGCLDDGLSSLVL